MDLPNAPLRRKVLLLVSILAVTSSLAVLILEGFTMPSAKRVKVIDDLYSGDSVDYQADTSVTVASGLCVLFSALLATSIYIRHKQIADTGGKEELNTRFSNLERLVYGFGFLTFLLSFAATLVVTILHKRLEYRDMETAMCELARKPANNQHPAVSTNPKLKDLQAHLRRNCRIQQAARIMTYSMLASCTILQLLIWGDMTKIRGRTRLHAFERRPESL